MAITLDAQTASQRCPQCDVDFRVVRGSVRDDGAGIGLYLIALHGHANGGRLAHLAVALRPSDGDRPGAVAAAIDVMARPDEFACSLVEWETSPWRDEGYLGRLLPPELVRASPYRQRFFEIAEHVVRDLPDVRGYFTEPER